MPGQTYLYNITGEPAGELMYHCNAPPTSLHNRMGMYRALIVDPKDKPVAPAREFVMVMGEYDLENQIGLFVDLYSYIVRITKLYTDITFLFLFEIHI